MNAHAFDRSTVYPSPATAAEDLEPGSVLEADQPEPSDAFDVNRELFQGMETSFVDHMATDLDSFRPFSASWQWTHEDLYLHNNGVFAPTADERKSTANGHYTPDQTLYFPEMETVQQQQDRPHDGGTREILGQDPARHLSDAVSEIICQATQKYDHDWQAWSLRLSRVVELPAGQDTASNDQHFLDVLINRYATHFHPLWPLISVNFSVGSNGYPLLVLTLSSIGALYSGANAARYGSLMHCNLRNALLEYKIRGDQQEDEALDIGRAMLLTQVAALYFEQKGAFSAAEQLGARLQAHAHRMRLFALKTLSRQSRSRTPNEHDTALAEGRRMLAYGILRAETFMSVLFNRKPMLSYEEIDLPLPFTRDSMLASTAVGINTDNFEVPRSGLLFSDLVRIALDPGEQLPILRPVDLELLMFGLQNEVWRFGHGPEMFVRLIQERTPPSGPPKSHTPSVSSSLDLLDHTTRKMGRLVGDYNALHAALSKWISAMQQSQLLYPVEDHRSAYLSGLVLHNLSLLRLYAPLTPFCKSPIKIKSSRGLVPLRVIKSPHGYRLPRSGMLFRVRAPYGSF